MLDRLLLGEGADLVGLAAILDTRHVPQPQLAGRSYEPATAVAKEVGELLDRDARLDVNLVGLAEGGSPRWVGVKYQQHRGTRRHLEHQLIAHPDQHGFSLPVRPFVLPSERLRKCK